jgi:hypothetical protein
MVGWGVFWWAKTPTLSRNYEKQDTLIEWVPVYCLIWIWIDRPTLLSLTDYYAEARVLVGLLVADPYRFAPV